MNTYKAILDTRRPNGVIATITQFDNATLALQIVTNGEIDQPWEAPQFELIAMKRDQQAVRESDQAAFTINDAGEHRVTVDLKEQFLTCRGSVKMQFIVKDGDRLSTSIFYVMVGESLDHDIIESHRDVAVLDELETYVKQGFDDLAYQEQRMKDVEKATHELNELMVGNEAERQAAEANRQALFEGNESQRQNTFNQQLTSQRREFDTSQADREGVFNALKQNLSSEFNAAQNEREREFDRVMASNQTQFNDAETSRASTFSHRQLENERTFTANENARQTLFNANEAGRQTNETDRVANENTRKNNETGRVAAEAGRQQKMSEFEAKATQLSDELDAQVARVDAFVSANEEKLLGDRDKVDYMGNTHESVKAASDANVDWLLGEVNTAHYEGQHITANDTIEGRAKSAILTGQTLVNLVGEKRFYTNNGASNLLCGWEFMLPYNLTNGKTYLAVFNATGTISDTNSKVYLMDNKFHSTTGNTDYPVDFKAGYNMVKCVASGDNHRVLRIRTKLETSGDFEVSDVMLIEYQDGMENWDIPYFEGMKSVQKPVLTTTGKNLLDSNNFVGNDFITLNQDQSFTVNSNKITQWSVLYKNLPDFNNVYIYVDIDGATNFGGSIGLFYKGKAVRELASDKRSGFLIKNLFDEIRIYNAQGTDIKVRLMLSYNDETSYEPYKSNILTANEDVTLRSNGDICDELNLLTGQLTQRIGEDGVVLSQEVVKTVDLSDNHVYSYKDVTHYDCSSAEGSLVPTLSVDVPTNLSALVSRQRATIETLESENQILKSGQADLELGHEHQEEEIISTQDAVNFLLFDVLNAASYRVGQKEYDRMAVYIANQIIRGKVSYQLAVSKYPQFLNDIDEILVNEGRGDLIVKID